MTFHFTFENTSDKVEIPADWNTLCDMIHDYPAGSIDGHEEIPLTGYGKAEVEFLIEIMNFIKTKDERAYKSALESNSEIDTSNFVNLQFDKFDQVDEKTRIQALNLSDYLGLNIAKKFLVYAFADNIIKLGDDVKTINRLVGGELLTPQDCIDNGLTADDKLWDAFPHIKTLIFGN